MTTQLEKDALVATLKLGLGQAQALTVDAPSVVTPPNVPPAQTGNVTAPGPSIMNRRFAWKADSLDPAKFPAPVPFNCYRDAANGIIAAPQNGVDPSGWIGIYPWGNNAGLYWGTPYFKDGVVGYFDPNSEDVLFADDKLYLSGRLTGIDGPAGLHSPYGSWRSHVTKNAAGAPIPKAPMWIGVFPNGIIQILMHNLPSIVTLGQVVGATGTLDLSLYLPNPKILLVADHTHTGTGRVIMIDRSAAIADRKATGKVLEDWHLWHQSDLITGLGAVTSIRCADDGTLYICDNTNKRIVKAVLDNSSGTPVLVSTTTLIQLAVGPQNIDITSQQHVAFVDSMFGVYVIDPAAPALGTNLSPATHRGPITFATLSVDRNGTYGQRDRIVFSHPHSGANVDVIFLEGPNWANIRIVSDIVHYPWVTEFHQDQGVLLLGGFAQGRLYLQRPIIASDPLYGADGQAMSRGETVLLAGTVAGHEGTVPSFACQMGPSGESYMMVTSDYILSLSKPDGSFDIDAATAYIRSGMAGNFPRPEIVGSDMMCLLYYLARNSQRYVREGRPLLESIVAHFPGSWPLNTPTPILPPSP